MTREKRLGRGLEALLGQISSRGPAVAAQSPAPAPAADAPAFAYETPAAPLPPPADGPGLRKVEIGRIGHNPAQPRQDFDPTEIQSLSESISAHGLLQPVVVRQIDDRYELVAGERRLRAAQAAGLTDVPANVIEADPRASAELAIVENLHRKDLNPLEKAASFQRYLEQYGCTQEELAGRLKLDRSTIANLIRLLELPAAVQDAVRQGRISQGHARALLPLGDDREQIDFCRRIEADQLSVRDTESLVQQAIDQADGEPLSVIDRDGQRTRADKPQSQQVAALEQQFRAALGVKVKLTHNAKGRGKLVIQFRNHEEFEQIRELICAPSRPTAQSHAG